MFSPSVQLTPNGVVVHAGGDPEPYEVTEIGDLLQMWHWRVEGIDPQFTLGDLVRLLRGADGLDVLSCLLNSPLEAVLEYAGAEASGAEWPLRYLEVCNVAVPTRYHPDPHRPDVPLQVIGEQGAVIAEEVRAAVSADPNEVLIAVSDADALTGSVEVSNVIASERHGSWGEPYHVARMLRGRGVKHPAGPAGPGDEPPSHEAAFDLFFVVVPEIAHLPLRYNADVAFDGGAGAPAPRQLAITVGEFLHAVFWGLGFNGTPENRMAMRRAVRELHPDFSGSGGHPLLRWNVPWVH